MDYLVLSRGAGIAPHKVLTLSPSFIQTPCVNQILAGAFFMLTSLHLASIRITEY